jgi:hypothetical protein
MLVPPKKHDPKNICIYVDIRWLNKETLIDHFPTPFSNEIINEFIGHEHYSFTDGFLGYNHVPKVKEN